MNKNNMEVKDLITTLGLDPEKIKTIEDFKTNVDSTFTRNTLINEDSEPVKKLLGQTFSTLSTELKRVAKANELDIDLDSDELKGKKVKDKLDFVFKSLGEKHKSVIETLTANAGKGNDDKVKDLESKLEKTNQKTKDLQALLDKTSGEYNNFKETSSNQLKGVKLDVLKKDAFGKIKFKADISEFEKKGYNAAIHELYNFDLDENESIIVKNKKGELIPSTKVTGTFKTVAEILEEEAVKGKLYQLNPDSGKVKPAATFQQTQQTQGATGVRKVAPRMG